MAGMPTEAAPAAAAARGGVGAWVVAVLSRRQHRVKITHEFYPREIYTDLVVSAIL